MKIVLSGIFYPMAILRYFEAALKRREDVELYTVGPFTGTYIPWGSGMHLPQKYAKSPDLPLPYSEGASFAPLPIGYIEARLPWQPDLWLQIDAGWFIWGTPQNGTNIVVGTDPHCLNYDRQRQFADMFYSMQTPYMREDDYYLPYAHDPLWHRPDAGQEQNFDACLIGLHYDQRTQLVTELRARGLEVYYDLGPSFEEARALYNQAPIGLNWSSLKDLTARVFELLGMGRLAVVNRVPDLDKFFKDETHLVVFDNLAEAVEKVVYYKEHPDEAEQIAQAGHEAVQAHTWDARIEQIFNEL